MNSKKRVAVAMSGGVDSSTAALLLKNQGYEVIGITGIMHEFSDSSVKNASDVCKVLEIPHYSADLKDEFKKRIISSFEESYKNGLTPNPCTLCNRQIKWGLLRDYARNELKAEFYATGHYARITKEDSNYKLCRAKDDKKDQIYMLFSLTQEDLATTLFPLSEFTKPEVRRIAKANNLPSAENPESQDVCFICPPDTTKKYLTRNIGEQEGNIVDINTGKVLGKHQGCFLYTIGQRKGIGIAAAEPLYVVSTDAKTNTVYVGYKKNIYSNKAEIINVNWQQPVILDNGIDSTGLDKRQGEESKSYKPFKALVKIRYNSSAKPATVIPGNNNTATVEFDEPVSAITPGQAAVFYDLNNEYLIGGGWITHS